jgi:hypothetical protein
MGTAASGSFITDDVPRQGGTATKIIVFSRKKVV